MARRSDEGQRRPFPESFYRRLSEGGADDVRPFPESFYRRLSGSQPLEVEIGEPTFTPEYVAAQRAHGYGAEQPLEVEIGEPTFTPEYVAAQRAQRRRPSVRTGPTAPITAPGAYESLAKYAPGEDTERQAALRYAAFRGGNGSSPASQMAALVLGGARPREAEALTPTQQALKWAAQRNMLAQAARIGGTAIGRGDAPGYAALERAAEEPLRGLEAERKEAERTEKLRRQQARMDPASPESRAAQRLLGTVPGMENVVGEMPAEQAPLALDVARTRAALQPKPGKTPEEMALEKRKVAADEMRARATLVAARRASTGGLSPAQQVVQERFEERQRRLRLEKLGVQTTKADFASMLDALSEVESLVPGATIGQTPAEIPATGLGERMLGAVGLRGWMGETEARVRQSIDNLRDMVKRARSGAAITSQEERFYLNLLGDKALASPQAMTAALTMFRRTLGKRLRDIQAPFLDILPDYIGTKYTQFLKPLGQSDQPARAAQRRVLPAGKIRVSNGIETAIIDAADEEEAAGDGFERVE